MVRLDCQNYGINNVTCLGNLAQLVLNSVGDAKFLTLCGEGTRLLELKEELDTLELSED